MRETAEHPLVHGKENVPVRAAQQASRVERRRLAEERSPAVVEWRDLEFQPTAAGQLQIAREPQAWIGFVPLDGPAVDDIGQPAVLGIATAASHAHASETEIQPASRSPKRVPEVPAVRAANLPDRRKDLRRGSVQNSGSRVDLLT